MRQPDKSKTAPLDAGRPPQQSAPLSNKPTQQHTIKTQQHNMKKLIAIIAITIAALCSHTQAEWVYTGCTVFDDNTIRTPDGHTGRIYSDGLVVFPGYNVSFRIYTNGQIYGSDGSTYQMVKGGHIYRWY
jgi:hypothetical protein